MIGKTMSWSTAVAFCVSLLAAGPLSSPPAWAQGGTVAQAPATKINLALPGSDTGTLLKVAGGTVRIGRSQYAVASGALVEDAYGNPIQLVELAGEVLEIPVRYWLGTNEKRNQIVQMILTFAE